MAISATFSSTTGILSIFSDAADEAIVISRDTVGNIFVNGGTVPIVGGIPTIANTVRIDGFGQGGNDSIILDETNGTLPGTNLFGGENNDQATGGSSNDMLFGQVGNDTLSGKGGNDFLFGGTGDDTLKGESGEDQVFGESGNDRLVWNSGDGNDLIEGGSGVDTAEVNGSNGAETLTVTANGDRVRLDRITPDPFFLDIGTTESLVVNLNGGNDNFSATGNLAALIQLTVDGGAGNDTILGSNGADLLIGGDGNDFVDGQQGNDVVLLGAGNDVFQWDPGDGSDVVEGQAGLDTLQFNGSNANERIDISANGARVRVSRDVAAIAMDLNQVEQLNFNVLGGTDVITVNDLSGTGATQVNLNLASNLGTGDAQVDTIVLNGTSAKDTINILGSNGTVSVTGLPAAVTIQNLESSDSLQVNANAGDDVISVTTLTTPVALTLDGGLGNDTLKFNGSNAAERIDIFANGSRARVFRDVDSTTMDLNQIEQFHFSTLGGTDTIVIGDLTGTNLQDIRINLSNTLGSGDGQEDRVVVNGTTNADAIAVASTNGEVTVTGLPAIVRLSGIDAGRDRLDINGLGGDDVIDASGLQANLVRLNISGGLGVDVLTGSAGNDFFNGGDGDDRVNMGAGDDVFVWNPGDDNDTLEGQAGRDEMLFNGANVAETIAISANGERVQFTRNIANIIMDMSEVEVITFNAQGGTDVITMSDLSGTDVTQVNLNLGSFGGGGDAQVDTIVLNGTSAEDTINILGSNGTVSITGLPAAVTIQNLESSDRLQINANAGDDVISVTTLTTPVALTLDGGLGNDQITGSNFADTLFGGLGNDTLMGRLGDDILDGGDGNDTLDGGDGNDSIFGGTGDDYLLSRSGADQMFGGVGDDKYVVDHVSDVVTEYASEGVDTVISSIDYTLGANVENLTLTDSAVNGIGNDLGNYILGNALGNIINANDGNDIVNGRGGDDYIHGGLGNDTLYGDTGNDYLNGSTGNDLFYGNDGNDTLVGGDGNDYFYGHAGNDVLIGGNGNDTLYGGADADRFRFELQSDGIDIIKDFNRTEGDKIEITQLSFGATSLNQFSYNSTTGALFFGTTQLAILENKPAGFSVQTDLVLV
jgi:Ca2+-binding RTX toxin-like protein